MSSNQSPSVPPRRDAGPVVSVTIPFKELYKLRDAVTDAHNVFIRLSLSLRNLDGFLKAAEAEAARDQSEYLPAAHNGREGELMSEGDRSSSLVSAGTIDQVGRHLDVTG